MPLQMRDALEQWGHSAALDVGVEDKGMAAVEQLRREPKYQQIRARLQVGKTVGGG